MGKGRVITSLILLFVFFAAAVADGDMNRAATFLAATIIILAVMKDGDRG